MRSAHITFALAFSLLTAAFATPALAGSTGGDSPLLPASTAALVTSKVITHTEELGAFNRLLITTSLKHTLKRPTTTYTVFAPTNAAVSKVPQRIRERMFVVGNPGLRDLVRRHIVAGTVDLSQLADGAILRTLSGEVLRVARQADGSVLLNGVYRVSAGRATANGMVYTLDSMIAPTN